MSLPYKKLYFYNLFVFVWKKFYEFIQDINFLADVEQIYIQHYNYVDTILILDKFRNITTLVVEGLVKWDENDIKINLPNLTSLKVTGQAVKLLSKIQSHKIEIFITKFYELTDDENKILGEFLETCNQLKHFTMEDYYTDQILKIKSKLVTFEVTFYNYKPLPSSFLEFLKSQKSSLKNLTHDVHELYGDIANFIYFEMNLDKIVDYRLKFGQIYELKETTVKNLAIKNEDNDLINNLIYYENLFNCSVMLEVLSVKLPVENQLEFFRLLSNLPKLKYLKLNCDRGLNEKLPAIKLNQLERLILSPNFNADQCVKIISCCPNLTHVTMSAILSKDNFDKIFEDCSKLQEILLFSINQINDEIFETFKSVGSEFNLKIETDKKEVFDKLSESKNQLTVTLKLNQLDDLFEVRPKILKYLHYDYNFNQGRNDYNAADYDFDYNYLNNDFYFLNQF